VTVRDASTGATKQIVNAFQRFDRAFAALLALLSAAVVVAQNCRLTILWDVSYILENATRIAAGDVPYRDFPFPYAPLTFLVQAAIIRILGRHFWLHVAYAALASAAASAVTYRIVRRFAEPAAAACLTLPLAVLGIYAIVPHPFYDPDCCLFLLLLFAALLRAGIAGWPPRLSFAIGAASIVPLFIKQNIGLAFAASLIVGMGILIESKRRRGVWLVIGGLAAGAAISCAIVAIVFGLGNYVRWTIAFAASRRLPPLAQQLAIYDDATLWWWLGCAVAGGLLMRTRLRARGVAIVLAPFAWSALRFFIADDPLEPQINLLRLWPLGLALVPFAIVANWREEREFARVLPLVVAGAIHGAFLSQSTWGSTYGSWPLLVILFAVALRGTRGNALVAAAIGTVMLLGGVHYVVNSERLTYAKVGEGEIRTSSLPALRGMHVRGEWLPDFDELVAFTERNIPRDDGIVFLPGEDLFYFATGRRPRFPVLMFDRTINPYDAATLARLTRERGIRWLIIKKRLQLNGAPMEELGATTALLAERVVPIAHLRNYDVYRLR
jgi:hypothetical protein